MRRSRISIKPNVRPGGRGLTTSSQESTVLDDSEQTQPQVERTDSVSENMPGTPTEEASSITLVGAPSSASTPVTAASQRRSKISATPNLSRPKIRPTPPTFEKTLMTVPSQKTSTLQENKCSVPEADRTTNLNITDSDSVDMLVNGPAICHPSSPSLPSTSGCKGSSGLKTLESSLSTPNQQKILQPSIQNPNIGCPRDTLTSSKPSPNVKMKLIDGPGSPLKDHTSDTERIFRSLKLQELMKLERKKERLKRKSGQPKRDYSVDVNPNELKLADFIYYLPESNPMKTHSTEQTGAGLVPPTSVLTPKISESFGVDNCNDDEDEDEMLVPKVTVAEDGSLVLDEDSLTVRVKRKSDTVVENGMPLFERGSETTYSSFRPYHHVKKWSVRETDMFFLAISMVGTDFSLMAELLTHRSRAEIKNKFKKEEKINAWRVDKAFKNNRPFDRDFFSFLLGRILAKDKEKGKSIKLVIKPRKKKKKSRDHVDKDGKVVEDEDLFIQSDVGSLDLEKENESSNTNDVMPSNVSQKQKRKKSVELEESCPKPCKTKTKTKKKSKKSNAEKCPKAEEGKLLHDDSSIMHEESPEDKPRKRNKKAIKKRKKELENVGLEDDSEEPIVSSKKRKHCTEPEHEDERPQQHKVKKGKLLAKDKQKSNELGNGESRNLDEDPNKVFALTAKKRKRCKENVEEEKQVNCTSKTKRDHLSLKECSKETVEISETESRIDENQGEKLSLEAQAPKTKRSKRVKPNLTTRKEKTSPDPKANAEKEERTFDLDNENHIEAESELQKQAVVMEQTPPRSQEGLSLSESQEYLQSSQKTGISPGRLMRAGKAKRNLTTAEMEESEKVKTDQCSTVSGFDMSPNEKSNIIISKPSVLQSDTEMSQHLVETEQGSSADHLEFFSSSKGNGTASFKRDSQQHFNGAEEAQIQIPQDQSQEEERRDLHEAEALHSLSLEEQNKHHLDVKEKECPKVQNEVSTVVYLPTLPSDDCSSETAERIDSQRSVIKQNSDVDHSIQNTSSKEDLWVKLQKQEHDDDLQSSTTILRQTPDAGSHGKCQKRKPDSKMDDLSQTVSSAEAVEISTTQSRADENQVERLSSETSSQKSSRKLKHVKPNLTTRKRKTSPEPKAVVEMDESALDLENESRSEAENELQKQPVVVLEQTPPRPKNLSLSESQEYLQSSKSTGISPGRLMRAEKAKRNLITAETEEREKVKSDQCSTVSGFDMSPNEKSNIIISKLSVPQSDKEMSQHLVETEQISNADHLKFMSSADSNGTASFKCDSQQHFSEAEEAQIQIPQDQSQEEERKDLSLEKQNEHHLDVKEIECPMILNDDQTTVYSATLPSDDIISETAEKIEPQRSVIKQNSDVDHTIQNTSSKEDLGVKLQEHEQDLPFPSPIFIQSLTSKVSEEVFPTNSPSVQLIQDHGANIDRGISADISSSPTETIDDNLEPTFILTLYEIPVSQLYNEAVSGQQDVEPLELEQVQVVNPHHLVSDTISGKNQSTFTHSTLQSSQTVNEMTVESTAPTKRRSKIKVKPMLKACKKTATANDPKNICGSSQNFSATQHYRIESNQDASVCETPFSSSVLSICPTPEDWREKKSEEVCEGASHTVPTDPSVHSTSEEEEDDSQGYGLHQRENVEITQSEAAACERKEAILDLSVKPETCRLPSQDTEKSSKHEGRLQGMIKFPKCATKASTRPNQYVKKQSDPCEPSFETEEQRDTFPDKMEDGVRLKSCSVQMESTWSEAACAKMKGGFMEAKRIKLSDIFVPLLEESTVSEEMASDLTEDSMNTGERRSEPDQFQASRFPDFSGFLPFKSSPNEKPDGLESDTSNASRFMPAMEASSSDGDKICDQHTSESSDSKIVHLQSSTESSLAKSDQSLDPQEEEWTFQSDMLPVDSDEIENWCAGVSHMLVSDCLVPVSEHITEKISESKVDVESAFQKQELGQMKNEDKSLETKDNEHQFVFTSESLSVSQATKSQEETQPATESSGSPTRQHTDHSSTSSVQLQRTSGEETPFGPKDLQPRHHSTPFNVKAKSTSRQTDIKAHQPEQALTSPSVVLHDKSPSLTDVEASNTSLNPQISPEPFESQADDETAEQESQVSQFFLEDIFTEVLDSD